MQHQTFKDQLEEVISLFKLAGHLTLHEYGVKRILETLEHCTRLGYVRSDPRSKYSSTLVEINTSRVTNFEDLITAYGQEVNTKVNPKKLYELAEVVLHHLTKLTETHQEQLLMSTFSVIKYMNNHYVLNTVSVPMLKAAGVEVIDGQSKPNRYSGL